MGAARDDPVDPTREIPAMIKEVRAGFASRQGQVRRLGHDPEEIERELLEDQERADLKGFTFETDARKAAPASAGKDVQPQGGATKGGAKDAQ